MNLDPETALAVCRFLHDAATMLLWGALAFLWTLVPAGLAGRVASRLSPARTASVAVAVATTAAALPLEAAAIGDGWTDALDVATVRAVLFDTSVGSAWIAEAAAALLLAATLAFSPRRRSAATALASGLLLGTLALTGHAAMQDGPLGLAHRINDALHVLAGGAWLGALVPLVPILCSLEDTEQRREAAVALRRFSRAGHAAVAIVIATGVANTCLVLGRWPTHWSSPYQALLATKIALVLAMTVLALVNRYVVVPRIGGARRTALHALRWSTIVEIVLGFAVLALVAVFGLLEPA